MSSQEANKKRIVVKNIWKGWKGGSGPKAKENVMCCVVLCLWCLLCCGLWGLILRCKTQFQTTIVAVVQALLPHIILIHNPPRVTSVHPWKLSYHCYLLLIFLSRFALTCRSTVHVMLTAL